MEIFAGSVWGAFLLTTLAGLIVVLFMIIGQISTLFDTIKSVFSL